MERFDTGSAASGRCCQGEHEIVADHAQQRVRQIAMRVIGAGEGEEEEGLKEVGITVPTVSATRSRRAGNFFHSGHATTGWKAVKGMLPWMDGNRLGLIG